MSKRDIIQVCTLSVLLDRHADDDPEAGPMPARPERAVQDALALQRISRNMRAKDKALGPIYTAGLWVAYLAKMRPKVEEILRPYGLRAEYKQDGMLHIIGLPGNTGEDGYGI